MNALSCTRIEAEIEISTVFFKILKVKRKNVFLQNEDKWFILIYFWYILGYLFVFEWAGDQ